MTISVDRITTGPLAQNCYVVAHSGGDAALVDPGDDFERIAAHIEERDFSIRAVIATHAHYDHVGAVAAAVERYGAPFYLHPADEGLLVRTNFYRAVLHRQGPVPIPALDIRLAEGSTLELGELPVEVIHTPGHTGGSVCLEIGGELFTGDTLLAGEAGRTDLPGGDAVALDASLARLAERYPPQTRLRPGHGDAVSLGDVLTTIRAAAR